MTQLFVGIQNPLSANPLLVCSYGTGGRQYMSEPLPFIPPKHEEMLRNAAHPLISAAVKCGMVYKLRNGGVLLDTTYGELSPSQFLIFHQAFLDYYEEMRTKQPTLR